MKPIRYKQSDVYLVDRDAPQSPPVTLGGSGYGWLELCWPSFGFCGILIGVFLATQTGQLAFASAAEHLRNFLVPQAAIQKTEPARVLIVTSNPDRRLQVIATLSPRGFEPLLAETGDEAVEQFAAHSAAVRLAVVDTAVPNSAAIARALRAKLPAARIIVLQASSPREAVGSILLNRL